MKFMLEITCGNEDQESDLHNFINDETELEKSIMDCIDEFYGFYVDIERVKVKISDFEKGRKK